jgi:hypothetical protein
MTHTSYFEKNGELFHITKQPIAKIVLKVSAVDD